MGALRDVRFDASERVGDTGRSDADLSLRVLVLAVLRRVPALRSVRDVSMTRDVPMARDVPMLRSGRVVSVRSRLELFLESTPPAR